MPEPTHYLDEPFVLNAARADGVAHGVTHTSTCRLLSAVPTLTEPVSPPEGLAPEDVAVVEASIACEDERGAPIPFAALAVKVSWLDEQRHAHAPYLGSKLGRAHPDQLVFELARAGEGLRAPRRYDPRTGAQLPGQAEGHARLVLTPAGAEQKQVVLAPWSRLQDAAFERWLDRLVLGLATAAPFDGLSDSEQGRSALVLLADLYNQTLEPLPASVLVASPIEQIEGQPRVTLSLQPASTLVGANLPTRIPTFSFELARRADGSLSLLRLLDPVGAQDALTCAQHRAELSVRLANARAAVADAPPLSLCNAQGLLLPLACAEVEPGLLARALEVGALCGASAAFGLDVGAPAPGQTSSVPSDFEVHLRRGSDLSSLAPGPRETLSIARSGRVLLESRSSAGGREHGPGEGRAAPALLAALWDQLQQHSWAERAPLLSSTLRSRAEPRASIRCTADERADLISVRADGRERSLRNRAGCLGDVTAEEFEALARSIEHVAGVEAFLAPDFSDLSRDAEIWVVAAE